MGRADAGAAVGAAAATPTPAAMVAATANTVPETAKSRAEEWKERLMGERISADRDPVTGGPGADTLPPVHESHRLRVRIFALLALAVVAAAPTRFAGAVNKKSVDKVTDLNKKALEAYAVSDFEKAKKLLKQALDVCT